MTQTSFRIQEKGEVEVETMSQGEKKGGDGDPSNYA